MHTNSAYMYLINREIAPSEKIQLYMLLARVDLTTEIGACFLSSLSSLKEVPEW